METKIQTREKREGIARMMQPEDLAAVAALEREIFSDSWSEKSFAEMMALEQSCMMVLLAKTGAEEELIGYVTGMSVLGEGELHKIAISPICRKQGFGQELLSAYLQKMRERNVKNVFLEVRAGNMPAIGLYHKNGFLPIGIRKDYYTDPKEDALVMETVLPKLKG